MPQQPPTIANLNSVVRYQFYDAVQSWLVLLVVGFCIGLVAACLDIASDWSNDVKFGMCKRGFWIPRHMCCPYANAQLHAIPYQQPHIPTILQPPAPHTLFMCCRDSPTISECSQWMTWGQLFSSSKGGIECAKASFF